MLVIQENLVLPLRVSQIVKCEVTFNFVLSVLVDWFSFQLILPWLDWLKLNWGSRLLRLGRCIYLLQFNIHTCIVALHSNFIHIFRVEVLMEKRSFRRLIIELCFLLIDWLRFLLVDSQNFYNRLIDMAPFSRIATTNQTTKSGYCVGLLLFLII